LSMSKAVVVLSGGLDSSTCMGIARSQGHELVALTVSYGQRHERELIAARDVAAYYSAEHLIIDVPLSQWGGSALTDKRIAVPTDRGLKEMAMEVPITYVPGRNLIFLALAASLAEARGCSTIYFGATQIDYSGYPDCRKEFVTAVRNVLQVGTKIGTQHSEMWRIETPLLMLGKKAIIQLGLELQVPYILTWSCYKGERKPCLECDSCKLRIAGFAELGMIDPLLAGS
jgi:7-cyano-7-deazaguanine synthase